MDARGGDQRELIRWDFVQLSLAKALFASLRDHPLFEADFIKIRDKYRRLVLTMDSHLPIRRGSALNGYFEELLLPRDVPYPPERPLTSAEAAEQERRVRRLEHCTHALFRHMWPDGRGWDNSTFDWQRKWQFNDVHRRMSWWAGEPRREANPATWSHEPRRSRRVQVRKYIDDVRTFCQTWNLDAPWAFHSIVGYHADSATLGMESVLEWAMSEVYTSPPQVRISVCVPGRSEEDFLRDRARLDTITYFETPSESTPNLVIHWPVRDRMLEDIELTIDSACLTFAWNGHPNDPMPTILVACEKRLGRPLSAREVRSLRGQARPQIRDAQREFEACGFRRMSMAEVKTQARWIAAKLVDPSRSWLDIARTDDPSGRYLSERNVGVQARRFAATAGLRLPTQRGTRRWIDR